MDFWVIMKLDRIKERIMKKIAFFLFIIVIIFSGCANNSKFKVGEHMSEINKMNTPYYTMNALSAYNVKSNYIIVIENESVVLKQVEFSPERKIIRTHGIDLVKCEDLNRLLGMDIAKLKEELGQPHVDVGSGFYIPAYITDDAYLICIELEDDIVFEVIKRDLLTSNIVARVSN